MESKCAVEGQGESKSKRGNGSGGGVESGSGAGERGGGLYLGCNCPGNLVVRGKMKDRNRRQGNKQKDHQSVRDSK